MTGSTRHNARCVSVFLWAHNVIMSGLFLPISAKQLKPCRQTQPPPAPPASPPNYVSPSAPKTFSPPHPTFHRPDLLIPRALKAHSGATKRSFVFVWRRIVSARLQSVSGATWSWEWKEAVKVVPWLESQGCKFTVGVGSFSPNAEYKRLVWIRVCTESQWINKLNTISNRQ